MSIKKYYNERTNIQTQRANFKGLDFKFVLPNRPIEYYQCTEESLPNEPAKNILGKIKDKYADLSIYFPLKYIKKITSTAIIVIITLVFAFKMNKNYSLEKFSIGIPKFFEAFFISEKTKTKNGLNDFDKNISIIGNNTEEMYRLSQNKVISPSEKNKKIEQYSEELAIASKKLKPIWNENVSLVLTEQAVLDAFHEILNDETKIPANPSNKKLVKKINDNRILIEKYIQDKLKEL